MKCLLFSVLHTVYYLFFMIAIMSLLIPITAKRSQLADDHCTDHVAYQMSVSVGVSMIHGIFPNPANGKKMGL